MEHTRDDQNYLKGMDTPNLNLIKEAAERKKQQETALLRQVDLERDHILNLFLPEHVMSYQYIQYCREETSKILSRLYQRGVEDGKEVQVHAEAIDSGAVRGGGVAE